MVEIGDRAAWRASGRKWVTAYNLRRKFEDQMRIRTSREHVATVALLAVSIAAAGCDQAKANQAAGAPAGAAASVPMPKTDRMPMAEFRTLLAKGEVVVIDVRSSDSYAAGHIPGALSIPEESITPATAEKLKRMGKPIAAYCS